MRSRGPAASDALTPLILLAWGIAVATIDLQRRRIPHALLLPVLVWAVAGLLLTGVGPLSQAPVATAAGLGIGLLLTVPGYLLGRVGGGDVKFAALIGALLGAPAAAAAFVLSGLLFGAQSLHAKLRGRQAALPMAPALAAGFIVTGPLVGLALTAGLLQ